MFRSILYFLLCFTVIVGCQDSSNTNNKDGIDIPSLAKVNQKTKQIDSLFSAYNKIGKFNGNVIVLKNGKELFHHSYGYAGSSKATPLTKVHQFGLGSIYKEFPAVSIMQLKEKGLLGIEDKVSKYIPGLKEWASDVTITNLLQYTSGLPRIDFNKYFGNNLPIGDDAIFSDLKNIQKLEFTPGSDYIYSNLNPFLLIKIVERISKKPFAKYINDELLTPLDMTTTQIKNEFPYKEQRLMANPFDDNFKEDQYSMVSSSMLFTSTVKDLSSWIENLNGFKVIGKESMIFLAKTANLKHDNLQAPLGNCVVENDEIIEHSHHGSMGNYEGLLQRYNKEDLTIVILTNQKNKNVFELSELIQSIANN